MKVRLHVQNLDEIPESRHEDYVRQDDGSYLLDWEGGGGYSIDNVSGLKSTLEKFKESDRQKGDLLAAYGDLDPEKAREAMSKIAEYDSLDPEQKVEEAVNARLEQISAKHTKEVDGYKSRTEQLTRTIKRLMIDDEVQKQLAKAECTGPKAEALGAKIRNEIHAEEKDGEFRVYVLGQDGQRRVSNRTDSNDYMTVQERIEELRSDKDWGDFFGAPQIKGVKKDSGGGSSAPKPGPTDGMSPVERLKAAHRAQAGG